MKKEKGTHKRGYKMTGEYSRALEDINQMVIAALEEENRQLKSGQCLMVGLGLVLGVSLFGGEGD